MSAAKLVLVLTYLCVFRFQSLLSVEKNGQKVSFLIEFPTTTVDVTFVKFIYSEMATKFCAIFTLDLSYVVPVKSTMEISQNFVAYSEYMNFTYIK